LSLHTLVRVLAAVEKLKGDNENQNVGIAIACYYHHVGTTEAMVAELSKDEPLLHGGGDMGGMGGFFLPRVNASLIACVDRAALGTGSCATVPNHCRSDWF
jgi:hypothetical protein